MSEAKGGSVINDSVEKEIGSLAWLGYSPPGLGFRPPKEQRSSVSPKRSTHPARLSTSARTERGWGGGAWSATVRPNCRYSAAASITRAVGLFLQSLLLSAETAVPAENLI